MVKKLKQKQANISDKSFWKKVSHYAEKAGKEVIEKALWLYYAAQRPETPQWAKRTVYGALFYFINPFDLLADLTPLLGYSDDLTVLTVAVATIAYYIDDEVKKKTADKLREWFDSSKAA